MAVAASHPNANARKPVIIQDVEAVSSCLIVRERAMMCPFQRGELKRRASNSRERVDKCRGKTVT